MIDREKVKPIVEIYTDGACRGNPGPGGWGVLLRYQQVEKTLSGSEPYTTNNQMELMAAIQGLENLSKPCHVLVYTDSEYVKNGITLWLPKWVRKHWKNSKGDPVKNQELWQRLWDATHRHEVEWHWVKGHSDHPENDRADELARNAIDRFLSDGKNSSSE